MLLDHLNKFHSSIAVLIEENYVHYLYFYVVAMYVYPPATALYVEVIQINKDASE